MVPWLRGPDAASAIQELSAALQREGCVRDLLPFYHSACNREYLCPTISEPGWTLPHALVKGLAQPTFALGRCPSPMVWLSRDSRVQLVCLLAMPEGDLRDYMNLVAGMARLSKDDTLWPRLMKANDAFGMFAVLQHVRLPAVGGAS
jgi:mannitol/fructose-specific phosphotransferase system IIA component (Ntr-type)